MFGCEPGSDKILLIDDFTKLWMYYSWLEDRGEENIKMRNLGCLIGAFWNPQEARRMMKDDEEKIAVSNEDFDEITRRMIETNRQAPPKSKKKRKKKIVFKKEHK